MITAAPELLWFVDRTWFQLVFIFVLLGVAAALTPLYTTRAEKEMIAAARRDSEARALKQARPDPGGTS